MLNFSIVTDHHTENIRSVVDDDCRAAKAVSRMQEILNFTGSLNIYQTRATANAMCIEAIWELLSLIAANTATPIWAVLPLSNFISHLPLTLTQYIAKHSM